MKTSREQIQEILLQMRALRGLQGRRVITKAEFNNRMHELNQQLWALKELV